MAVRWIALLLLGACGSPTPPAPTARGAAPTPGLDATPAAPLVASIAGVLTAGPLTDDQVTARLRASATALGACAVAPVAIEIGLSITAEDVIPRVVGYRDADPAITACVGAALGAVDGEVVSDGEPTFVYAIVALARAGEPAPALPTPPVLAVDVEAMCEMHTRSGAMDRPIGERQERMSTWFKATVRHPAVYHLTWQFANMNPNDDLKAREEEFVRAAGLDHCAISGW